MPKSCKAALSREEWDALGQTLETKQMAEAIHASTRYVHRHAAELGGRMVAGKWLFSKKQVADLLGIDE